MIFTGSILPLMFVSGDPLSVIREELPLENSFGQRDTEFGLRISGIERGLLLDGFYHFIQAGFAGRAEVSF